jgi:flagellar biosynthesis protein FliR
VSSAESLLISIFIVFCRVGGCLMLLPGFSSERIPVRVRLYVAVGVSGALASVVLDSVRTHIVHAPLLAILAMAVSELLVGAVIGLIGRLFLLALETLMTGVAMTLGVASILQGPMSEDEPLPALASFAVLGATTLMFVLDQHWIVIQGIHQSYAIVPINSPPNGEAMLDQLLRTLEHAYLLAFRISSPFLLFGIVINVAFGFLNRMVPSVPIFFVSSPFVIAIGGYWMYVMMPDMFGAFASDLDSWLSRGG